MNPAATDRTLTLPRVGAALCGIALLALVLPYAAVRALHERRLDAADRQLEAIATALGTALGGGPAVIPDTAHVLAGPGPRPIVDDDRWTTASAFPLARLAPDVGPDPWRNAYLVHIRDRRAAYAISAGPDGILQTPFTGIPPAALGDDRIATIR